ncbi:DUF799 domain-containing protein [Pseudoduganella violaceinigra]|uniref:DUF799 domain-containing protein n=1 Tax=Pseudoduganella violaceinigra TaxID=246602 RepID=UPI0003F81AD8|nr:GNA1162 family protein [Pseudoduganella violaceinigra]
MKQYLKLFALGAMLAVLAGCASKVRHHEQKDYTEFRKADPKSVLVVPVVSRSVDVDAPDYFLSTITVPLAERGYYVFPVNLVKHVLEDDGLADANLVHSSDTSKLAEMFGTDAVLYVTIERWDSKYAVVSTVTTVELSYVLKSAEGQELWTRKEQLAYDPAANQNGLIAMAIASAIEKAKPNYIPLARQVNSTAIASASLGLPAGPYDAQYRAEPQAQPQDTRRERKRAKKEAKREAKKEAQRQQSE